jgi:L-alanine-DL-glutamate epimerase-like enolase superfamily enzyme
MEIDIDSVKWRDEFFLNVPEIENGDYVLGTGSGWGCKPNEAAIRKRKV